MYKNWKEVAKIESKAVRISFITASMDSLFIKEVLANEDGKQLFTENPPHENPMPLTLGRELCEQDGQFIGEYEILPINHLDDDALYIKVPEGVELGINGESPYYDLFYDADQKPVFIEVLGVKMLLVHFSHDGDGYVVDFLDPRCVDLEA